MDRLVALQRALGDRARPGEPLSRHTTARIGGPADLLIEAMSADELCQMALAARRAQVPVFVLGGGANVLVSDAGVRGLTIVNKARRLEFLEDGRVRGESGVILPTLARECVARGLAGLEWAVGVPGTLGGAVVGNAGAHGRDTASDVSRVRLLCPDDVVREWPVEELAYAYRDSRLKRAGRGEYVVLAAEFQLARGDRAQLEARAAEFNEHRRRTQPPGASIGSMFKNPPGEAAGRLIDRAGLKGTRAGRAEISTMHANFFVNLGGATAVDVMGLITLARQKVREKFGVALELEIELAGDWPRD